MDKSYFPAPRSLKAPRLPEDGGRIASSIRTFDPRSGSTSAAGLLTYGSLPSGAFPSFTLEGEAQWLHLSMPEDSPITVAGPCRTHTGFPILPFEDPD